MTVRVPCDGRECDQTIAKGDTSQNGWTVVVSYPLLEGDSVEDSRRHLCRVCTRRHRSFFR